MATATLPAPPSEKSWLERLLSPLADVRAGEGPVVLLLALNLFLVMLGYYVLKTVREALVLTESGAAVKTYASAGQALLLLVLVPAFAAFASRVNRMRLLTGVTAFFIVNLALFYLAGKMWGGLGIPFFLWVGIFNTMGIAQFWAFANDLYTPEQGKRLFAIIMLGANLGALVGGLVAKAGKSMGPYNLMLLATPVLVACIVVARVANRLQVKDATPEKAAEAEEHLGKVGAFALLRKDRYLMLIAALVVLINIVNTTGEYLLGRLVVEASEAQFGTGPASLQARQAFVTSFYGGFYSLFNLLGLSLQIFAVSRVMSVLGVGGALFIHPLVAVGGYLSMAGLPSSLTFVRNLKVLDNSLDYSLNNTAKQALWLPTSREAKYKAKQAVDAFFYRAGDVLAAVVVWLGQRLAFTVPVFAAINAAVALVWLVVAWALRRENQRRAGA